MNLKTFKNELLFLPLGGSGEIGLNCNLYHYNGKWLIVDMGIGFVRDLPGVDVAIPDIKFIKDNIKDFLGILITHIHEDHLGAIQYLWEELKLPIYTSKFTALFLKEKLSEYDFGDKVKIIVIDEDKPLKLDPFELEFIGLTHSTPEMNSILIKTEKGNILHTGDWKFDEKPILGKCCDKKRLKKLGDKGEILAVTCDSTNVFKSPETRNETDLLKSLKSIIKGKNGLVVCTIFASNIARIISISLAAKACNRKVAIVGRSIFRILKVANEMDYIPKGIEFISENDIPKYDKKGLVIISAGCQGESGSGLSKIANGLNNKVNLTNGDTVIFSSSIIPGNEKNIYELYNKLSERDVEIINENNAFVHLSGHYTKNELIELYKLIKPKIVIATHGEEMQLSEHKRIATNLGIKNVIKAKDGCIVKISKDETRVIDKINLTNLAIDGRRILPVNSGIISERNKLSEAGIIFISLLVDKNYKLTDEPSITAVGNYDFKQEKDMHEELKEEINKSYNRALKKIINVENSIAFDTAEKKENHLIKEITADLKHIFQLDMGKKPFISAKIFVIN